MPQGVKAGALYMGTGVGISGIFLLGFNVVVARWLGTVEYGTFSILFSMIMVNSAFLGLGMRNALAKYISEYEAHKKTEEIYSVIKCCLKIEIFIVAGFLIFIFFFKESIIVKFFDGNRFFFLIFMTSAPLYGFVYTFRGILLGLREFKLNALTLISESVSRILFLIIFVVILNWGISGAGLSLLAAPLLSLLVLLSFHSKIKMRYSTNKSRCNYKKIMKFIMYFMLIVVSNRFILFSGPIFIKLLGKPNSNELVGLFMAAMFLVRIPLFLFNALFASLFPNISRADALKNKKLLSEYIKKSSLLITLASVLMIIAVFFVGPTVMQLLYGKEFIFGRSDMALLSIMAGFYLFASLFNNVLIARAMLKEALFSWSVAVAFLVIFVLFVDLNLLLRVELGLLFSSLFAAVLLSMSLKDSLIGRYQ